MKKNICVLQIVSNLNKNGPAFVVNDLSLGLKNNNCEVIIASSGGVLEKELESNGIGIINIPIQRIDGNKVKMLGKYAYNFISSIRSLVRIIKEYDIDIIHAHQPVPIMIGKIISKICKKPIVTTAHNIYDPKVLTSKMYTKGDLVISVSEKVRISMINTFGVPKDKVFTIHNGINTKRIQNSMYVKGSIRDEFKINKDCTLVGVIAGLREQKGLDYFIKSAKCIIDEIDNVKFIIVGEGPLKNSLVELTKSLDISDKVIFTGFRNDVGNIINDIDIFCLSSLYEGLPIALLEALANSKPVLVTDVGGIPEIIEHGVNGMMVPPRNVELFSNTLKSMLLNKDLIEKLRINAYKSISEELNENSMAIKHIYIYKKLIR